MRVLLNKELEQFVSSQVCKGGFKSASEVVASALEVMKEQEEFIKNNQEWLRKEIDIGISQLDRGEGEQWDPNEVIAEGRKLLAANRKRRPRKRAG